MGEVKLILLRTGIVAVCCSVLISIFALKQFQNASPPSLSSGKRNGLALATAVCAVLSISFFLDSAYGTIASSTVYERLAEGSHAAITDPVSLLCTALADGVSHYLFSGFSSSLFMAAGGLKYLLNILKIKVSAVA